MEVQSKLVLHVDDETIDLRRIGNPNEPVHATGALCGEAIHVEPADDRSRCWITHDSDRLRDGRGRNGAIRYRERCRASGGRRRCLTSDRWCGRKCDLGLRSRRSLLVAVFGRRGACANEHHGKEKRSLTKLMHITHG
jgi:hypothetical protein